MLHFEQTLTPRFPPPQSEIHVVNEETKEEVSSWVENSKILQEDIIRSKQIASDIIRQSEAPDVSGEFVQDIEEKAGFLNREVQHSQHLRGVLGKMAKVKKLLREVEDSNQQRHVLDSLRLLESKLPGNGPACADRRLTLE